MNITIKPYENWMKREIVELFVTEYDIRSDSFSSFFEYFYLSPFQKDKALLIVALDDNKVIGFQSFFYWPYSTKNKRYNSLQSGNSIVSSNYRGKGIFRMLLNYIDKQNLDYDFIVGFPVEASFKSFIRNGWDNPFNLQWYIKIINVPSIAFNILNHNRLNIFFYHKSKYPFQLENNLKLERSNSFTEWQRKYSQSNKLFCSYSEDDLFMEFELKYNVRKSILGELVIGNINTNTDNTNFTKKAFNHLFSQAKKARNITFISIAINPNAKSSLTAYIQQNLNEINKQIYFITKSFSEDKNTLQNWNLYRGDIDTW